MKKIVFLLLAVLSLTIVSCKQSVPDQLLKIAKEAEAKGDKWSQEKWAETINQFGELLDKFEASDESDNTFKAIKVFGATYRFSEQAAKYVVAPELKAKLQGMGDQEDNDKDGNVEEGGGVEDDAEEALPGLEKAANDVVNDAAEKLGDALKGLGL